MCRNISVFRPFKRDIAMQEFGPQDSPEDDGNATLVDASRSLILEPIQFPSNKRSCIEWNCYLITQKHWLIKGCTSDVGWCHFRWYLKGDPKETEPARPSLPCFVHPVKTIMIAAQNPTSATPCGDWLEYYLFWFWVVGSTICFCVRSPSIGCLQRPTFLTACLWGGQLEDREEKSDECVNICFGLESLLQPLRRQQQLQICPQWNLEIGSLSLDESVLCQKMKPFPCLYRQCDCFHSQHSDPELFQGLEQENGRCRFPRISIPFPIHTWLQPGNLPEHCRAWLHVGKGFILKFSVVIAGFMCGTLDTITKVQQMH